MKMPRTYPSLVLIASFLVLIFSLVFGTVELLFPAMFLLWFSAFFLVFALRANIQVDANPGLKELDEPDYWWSQVYDAWLYVADRKQWASYTCLWSCVFGGFFGSTLGVPAVLYWKPDFYASLVSWLSGMFMMLSVAGFIAGSNYWKEAQEQRRG
jgi:hypothetical protein